MKKKKELSEFELKLTKNLNKKIKVIFKNGYEQEGTLVDWDKTTPILPEHIVISQKKEEHLFQNFTILKEFIKEIIPIHIEERSDKTYPQNEFLASFKK